MKYLKLAVIVVTLLAVASVASASPMPSEPTAKMQPAAPPPQAKQLVIYMQMGGTQGDASTLARTNGAKAAAAAYGVKLVEQYSGWDPQKMIDQFKEAMAANPDGIEIMGHPGEAAFAALVDQAESQGIIVTSGNNPLPNIQAKYQTKGFGYAGADLHAGGFLTGQAMVAAGLKAGDEAVVYDIWHNEGRSKSSQGIVDALEAAGVKVDKLDASDAVDKDASLAIPILTAYIAAHPNLKAIGTQHGNITANLPKVLQAAGKKLDVLATPDGTRDRFKSFHHGAELVRPQGLVAVAECLVRVRMDLDQEAVGAAGDARQRQALHPVARPRGVRGVDDDRQSEPLPRDRHGRDLPAGVPGALAHRGRRGAVRRRPRAGATPAVSLSAGQSTISNRASSRSDGRDDGPTSTPPLAHR